MIFVKSNKYIQEGLQNCYEAQTPIMQHFSQVLEAQISQIEGK